MTKNFKNSEKFHKTGNLDKTGSFDKEHRYYGGMIFLSDFNTNHRGKNNAYGSHIASRIEADLKRSQNQIRKEL